MVFDGDFVGKRVPKKTLSTEGKKRVPKKTISTEGRKRVFSESPFDQPFVAKRRMTTFKKVETYKEYNTEIRTLLNENSATSGVEAHGKIIDRVFHFIWLNRDQNLQTKRSNVGFYTAVYNKLIEFEEQGESGCPVAASISLKWRILKRWLTIWLEQNGSSTEEEKTFEESKKTRSGLKY